MIDERTHAALARLTENERACLIRRLSHQTAKEMAIELGISPHAVEKRLKMARTKLGVSSSLEAARLLEASERYGRTGPQASDLAAEIAIRQDGADPATPRPAWRRIAPYLLTGAVAMSLAIVALLAVAPLYAPPGGVAPLPEGGTVPMPDQRSPKKSGATSPGTTSILKTIGEWEEENHITRPSMVKASPELLRSYVNSAFDAEDRNHSGFIERDEAPTTGVAFETIVRKGAALKPSERPLYPDKNLPVAVIGGKAGQAAWIAIFDKDGDGKASREEYMAHNYEMYLARGLPSGWQAPPGPTAMVRASPEIVRAFVNESFDLLDSDHSGFIERAEVRAPSGDAVITASRREGEDSKAASPVAAPDADKPDAGKNVRPFVTDPVAQAAWLARLDKDGDDRVDREEYLKDVLERFLIWGVPANWHGAPKVAAK